jgi:uncharacterized membrane protein YdjX (TVP38/TMEM64 family)
MASGGFRLGAWGYLCWKHVSPITNEKGEVIAAKLLPTSMKPFIIVIISIALFSIIFYTYTTTQIARAIEQENNTPSSTIYPCHILNRYECPFDKKKSNNNNNKINEEEEKEGSNPTRSIFINLVIYGIELSSVL